MTTTTPRAVQCPECGATDAIDLSTGDWLCLSCRTEWNPDTVPIVPPGTDAAPAEVFTLSPSLARIFAADDAAEVLRAPREEMGDTDAGAAPPDDDPDTWAGAFVRYERMGLTCLCVEDKGRTMIELQDVDGTTYKVKRSSCVFLGRELDAAAVAASTPDGAPVDDQPLAQTILAVAGLTLTVACDAIDNATDEGVGNPRIGWLPPPCDQVPEVEQAVAYASAFLIRTWGLDTTEVRKLAANLLTGASMDAGEEVES